MEPDRNAAETTGSGLKLRDLLSAVGRNFRGMLAVVLASVCAAGLYAALAQPVYVASSKILVQLGREKFSSLNAGNEHAANIMFYERPQDINNEIEILRDSHLTDGIIDALLQRRDVKPIEQPAQTFIGRLKQDVSHAIRAVKDGASAAGEWVTAPLYQAGLLKKLPATEQLAKQVRAALAASAAKEADVIVAEFGWSDPDFAAFALNALIDEFRRRHVAVQSGADPAPFYKSERDRIKGELDAVNVRLNRYMQTGGVTDVEMEKSLTLQFISDLEKQRNGTALALDQITVLLATTQHAFAAGNAWIETLNPEQEGAGSDSLDRSFAEVTTERNQALTRFTPQSRQVRDIDQRLAELRRQKYQRVMNFYAARRELLTAKLAQLDATLAEKKAISATLTAKTLELEDLQQRRTLLRTDFATYDNKIEALRVSSDLNADSFTNINVISKATPPTEASYPRKGLLLGLSVLFGLLAAVGYVQVAEMLNHTFRTERDVARILGLRVLASLPHVPA